MGQMGRVVQYILQTRDRKRTDVQEQNYNEKYSQRIKMYTESKVWKCEHSPTGAHHWKEVNNQWECKYCYRTVNSFKIVNNEYVDSKAERKDKNAGQ